MVKISGLFVYPIKSCRGISLAEVELGPRGLLHDREFLVVDDTNTFLTQRNAPELATIDVHVDAGALTVRTSEHGTFVVPEDELGGTPISTRRVTIFHDEVLADDLGAAAAEWFSEVLHRRSRLVRIGQKSVRHVPLARVADDFRAAGPPPISFTDAFPTLLVSEASVQDLNTRLPQPIPFDRFRPNILVTGTAAYEEDTWRSIAADDLVFGCSAACLRCVITTTDQRTGERDGAEPLRTLATYRRAPDGSGVMFGQYLVHSGSGRLRVGQELLPSR